MKNGILRNDEGYDLLVDGVDRSFRDLQANAVAGAFCLKETNPRSKIQIRDRSNGTLVTVLENGTLG
jgi:hypothetical protein